jgi:membrane-associated phospholipid phosphatase
MRRSFVLAALALYLLVALGSAAGLWRPLDVRLARAAAAPVRGVLGPAVCVADLAGGLTATGTASALLSLGFPAAGGGRRLAMFGGWLAISLAEAAQKSRLPVVGPPGAVEGPRALWCESMHALADRPALAAAGALLLGAERLLHRPLTPRPRPLPYSFPSGHAARVLYALGLLAAGRPGGSPAAWAAAGGGALAEGWVLTAAHWHWATDVLAGWLLAGVALATVLPRRRRR